MNRKINVVVNYGNLPCFLHHSLRNSYVVNSGNLLSVGVGFINVPWKIVAFTLSHFWDSCTFPRRFEASVRAARMSFPLKMKGILLIIFTNTSHRWLRRFARTKYFYLYQWRSSTLEERVELLHVSVHEAQHRMGVSGPKIVYFFLNIPFFRLLWWSSSMICLDFCLRNSSAAGLQTGLVPSTTVRELFHKCSHDLLCTNLLIIYSYSPNFKYYFFLKNPDFQKLFTLLNWLQEHALSWCDPLSNGVSFEWGGALAWCILAPSRTSVLKRCSWCVGICVPEQGDPSESPCYCAAIICSNGLGSFPSRRASLRRNAARHDKHRNYDCCDMQLPSHGLNHFWIRVLGPVPGLCSGYTGFLKCPGKSLPPDPVLLSSPRRH